jgi:hypothetical protein
MWVYDGFYTNVNGQMVKSVPVWIGDYLTPLAIAHWFMQDGSYARGQGVCFATNSFSYADCVRLAGLLTSMYDLQTSVISAGEPGQWRISV